MSNSYHNMYLYFLCFILSYCEHTPLTAKSFFKLRWEQILIFWKRKRHTGLIKIWNINVKCVINTSLSICFSRLFHGNRNSSTSIKNCHWYEGSNHMVSLIMSANTAYSSILLCILYSFKNINLYRFRFNLRCP